MLDNVSLKIAITDKGYHVTKSAVAIFNTIKSDMKTREIIVNKSINERSPHYDKMGDIWGNKF